MFKSPQYYYQEDVFQLDLNLQTVTRELIDLIEEHNHDCIHCKSPKCSCIRNVHEKSIFSLFQHDMSNASTTNTKFRIPPPANTLPKPEWITDNPSHNKKPKAKIRNWIRNSKTDNKRTDTEIISNEENYIWPPFPESIWSVESKVQNEMVNSDEDTNSSVKSFFRYFSYKINSMSSSKS